MEKLITAFTANILEALEIASGATINQPKNEVHNVLICGMGGSGIGGKIVSQWIQDDSKVPVLLLNDYTLPNYVDKHSIVIGSSYSGNTEETLIALKKAKEQGAHIIGICSGGEVKEFCIENGYDFIVVPGGNPPRTAVAFSIVQLLNIFIELGMTKASRLNEVKSAHDLLIAEQQQIHSKAKELAAFLQGKVGVFYSGPRYEGVAVRARQQFNENSKLLCWHHVIPEMNHNELVGWGGGDDRFAVVFFQTNDLIPRNQRRYEITFEEVKSHTSSVMEISSMGSTQIERSFYLINLVDWASYYLALDKNVDAMDIHVIDYLKNELAKLN
jgi:glucose/mannose-6-phosphate isomerase